MDKVALNKVCRSEDKFRLTDEEMKKITDLFTLFIQIDQREKRKEVIKK